MSLTFNCQILFNCLHFDEQALGGTVEHTDLVGTRVPAVNVQAGFPEPYVNMQDRLVSACKAYCQFVCLLKILFVHLFFDCRLEDKFFSWASPVLLRPPDPRFKSQDTLKIRWELQQFLMFLIQYQINFHFLLQTKTYMFIDNLKVKKSFTF